MVDSGYERVSQTGTNSEAVMFIIQCHRDLSIALPMNRPSHYWGQELFKGRDWLTIFSEPDAVPSAVWGALRVLIDEADGGHSGVPTINLEEQSL